MKTKLLFSFVVLSVLALAGCSSLSQAENQQKEKYLISAGFKARPVDTDKKRALVATLTPYKIQSRLHKGTTLYVYPDPSQNIVYVGGPAEYQAYKKMTTEDELVTQQQMSNMEYDAWATQITGGDEFTSLPEARIR